MGVGVWACQSMVTGNPSRQGDRSIFVSGPLVRPLTAGSEVQGKSEADDAADGKESTPTAGRERDEIEATHKHP